MIIVIIVMIMVSVIMMIMMVMILIIVIIVIIIVMNNGNINDDSVSNIEYSINDDNNEDNNREIEIRNWSKLFIKSNWKWRRKIVLWCIIMYK